MAKNIDKPLVQAPADAPEFAANVAGVGFKTTFKPADVKEIRTKRRAMHKRLFAVG
jgi:hypothetical protein